MIPPRSPEVAEMTLLSGQKRTRSEDDDGSKHHSDCRFRLDQEGAYVIDFYIPETIVVFSEDDASSWSEFPGDLLETFPVVQEPKKSGVWKLLSEQFERKSDEEELDCAFITKIIEKLYPQQKAEELIDIIINREDPSRSEKIHDLSRSPDQLLKFLFTIVQCLDYFKTNLEGQHRWAFRKQLFQERFANTIVKYLQTNKSAKRKAWLEATLHHTYAYISYLIEDKKMPLQGNLCFFLCVASCIEGRGKYHGRTSKNLSAMLQCYRYLIETIGGIKFSEIPEESRRAHERTLIESFESF